MLEGNPPEHWTEERERLLQTRLSDLGLKIEGTRVEKIVARLYDELGRAGIGFRPKVYLADEWGCPSGIPIIGIPFYLVDERLSRIEDEFMEGIETETDEEILRYLRHEAGHAFNYAYTLYESEEWTRVFGSYARPYRENYRPNPFSLEFVRHIPGWYAQKHPDEDFAETFAVWLTPGSNWREDYKEWGCYKKLLYVERVVAACVAKEPPVTAESFDVAADLRDSIRQHYEKFQPQPGSLPAYFDGDLKGIFERSRPSGEESWAPAHEFLRRRRRGLVRAIGFWTGLDDATIRSLVDHLVERAKKLDLYVDPARHEATLTAITAYATTLCMNKLYKGDFVLKGARPPGGF